MIVFPVITVIVLGTCLWLASERAPFYREHFYQKLILAGWRTRDVLAIEYSLMFAVGLTGVMILNISILSQVVALLLWAVIYCLLMLAVEISTNRKARIMHE